MNWEEKIERICELTDELQDLLYRLLGEMDATRDVYLLQQRAKSMQRLKQKARKSRSKQETLNQSTDDMQDSVDCSPDGSPWKYIDFDAELKNNRKRRNQSNVE